MKSSMLLLSIFLAGSSPGQDLATSLPEYLRRRGFSTKELAAIERGEAVVNLIEAQHDTETELLGVVKIHGEPEEFIARYRDIVSFEKGAGVLQIGLFSDPPRVSDLDGLTLDPVDAEDLKKCRPGDCDIKLSEEAIQTFQRFDWSAEDSIPKAEALARQMIVDFLKAYQEGGNAALGTLHDNEKPLAVREDFEEMIRSPDLPAYFPDLFSYLNGYPAAGIPGAEELFYWSKVDFGLKPTIRLNHVVIYEPSRLPSVRFAVASKMLYSSHYFNTGIEMKFLVAPEDSPDAYYLVSSNQSRSDGFTGLTGFFAGRKIRGKASEGLESYLASVKRSFEGVRPAAPWCYDGFVYEAFPGGDLVEKGLHDLAEDRETTESLLVSMGAPRLRAAGIPVPERVFENAERRLYDLLATEDEDSAHSRYNALVRRLSSFEDAVECVGR